MLSVGESARQLGVSPSRVRALIKEGRLPAAKNGREWMIREEDVLQSQEEASFYMAVFDFFLQQRQRELVKEGVF